MLALTGKQLCVAFAVAMLLVSDSLQAQLIASAERRDSDWYVGGSIGLPATRELVTPLLLTAGLHVTQLRPGWPNPDLSVVIFPAGLFFGAVVVGGRLNVSFPFQSGPELLIAPTGGVSVAGASGFTSSGGDWISGYNVGANLISFSSSRTALRVGVSRHWQFANYVGSGGGGVWYLEVGFLRASGQRSEN